MPLPLLFTQPGTFTFDDNGIPGDNTSVIRDSNGVVIFTFVHPVDALSITVSTPGVNLIVNITDSLGAADFSIGDLTNSGITPDSIVMKKVQTTGDVTLVSNGAITEGGSDAAADIIAGTLIMSAVSRIGTGGNAIETQTSFIEAETTTGGINIRNTGSVQIGGLTDQVNGLDVLESGNLNLTAIGSIFLSDIDLDAGNPPTPPVESVHGGNTSGNVTLTAQGFTSDIISNTDTDAVTAVRGNITLTAGRDVALGTIGTDFDNDVRANGSVTVNAGRDFLLDGFSDLSSDAFFNNTGGDVIINSGRNIQLRNIAGDNATITASGTAGGDVLFTTGFGGAVILDAPSTTAVNSTSGDVVVSADRMLIGATSGITANAGSVTLRPATAGRAIFIGSASDAALAVELADSELDRVFTSTLNIGDAGTGLVRIIAPFSPANTPDLSIRGNGISIESSFSTINDLTLRADDDIFQLGATLITAGGTFKALVDDVQDDDDTGGTGIFRGAVTASSIQINGNLDADTLEGTDGDDRLTGDAGADTLRGRGGADILDGGSGADQMVGGLGDDTYKVDNFGDTVVEAVGEGTDTVQSSVSHVLADNVEKLVLTGSANANGTGNDLDNRLTGNIGNNALNGRVGADTMLGGAGDDTYTVDNVGDVISEASGAGTDTVRSLITFTLAGKQVENLTLLAGGDINGTGNSFDNAITGNSGDNILNGVTGSDTLTGAAGSDTFVFANALGASNIDSIADFNVAADTIRLDSAIFNTIVGTGTLSAAQFVANAAGTAQDANDRIIYDTDSGQLFFDNNGNGAGGSVQFALLDAGLGLTNADFVVV